MRLDEIQRKHREETEAVVDDALYDSMDHLMKACNYFEAVNHDRGMKDEFAKGVAQAQQVLLKLGIEC